MMERDGQLFLSVRGKTEPESARFCRSIGASSPSDLTRDQDMPLIRHMTGGAGCLWLDSLIVRSPEGLPVAYLWGSSKKSVDPKLWATNEPSDCARDVGSKCGYCVNSRGMTLSKTSYAWQAFCVTDLKDGKARRALANNLYELDREDRDAVREILAREEKPTDHASEDPKPQQPQPPQSHADWIKEVREELSRLGASAEDRVSSLELQVREIQGDKAMLWFI